MKRALAPALSLAALLSSPPAQASDADPWFGKDKALHFGVSAGVSCAGFLLARDSGFDDRRALLYSGSAALALGVGKELYDLTGRGDPSLRDLTWDVIGTATGLAVGFLVERYLLAPLFGGESGSALFGGGRFTLTYTSPRS